eukprot:COSAG02_NODE_4956_length_4782_cov_4.343370_1_plen_311_part_00
MNAMMDSQSSSESDGDVEQFGGGGLGIGQEPSGDFTAAGFANEASPAAYSADADDDWSENWEPGDDNGESGGSSRAGEGDVAEESEAAAHIQSVQRGKQTRRELQEQEDAAVKIQAVQRGKQARKQPKGVEGIAEQRAEPELDSEPEPLPEPELDSEPEPLPEPELEPEPEPEQTVEEELAVVEADNETLRSRLSARDEEIARLQSRLEQINGGDAPNRTPQKPTAPKTPRSGRKSLSKKAMQFNQGLYLREKQTREQRSKRLAARKQQFLDAEMEACTFRPVMLNKADGSCAILPQIKSADPPAAVQAA